MPDDGALDITVRSFATLWLNVNYEVGFNYYFGRGNDMIMLLLSDLYQCSA